MNDDEQWKKTLLNAENAKQKLAAQQEKERQDKANGVIDEFPEEQSLSLQTIERPAKKKSSIKKKGK